MISAGDLRWPRYDSPTESSKVCKTGENISMFYVPRNISLLIIEPTNKPNLMSVHVFFIKFNQILGVFTQSGYCSSGLPPIWDPQ